MNHGFTYTGTLGLRDEGQTLLAHLAGRYVHTSEEVWRERIEEGLVHLDGRPAGAGDLLRRSQILTWMRPPWEEPEVPLGFAVLYEDEDLVAVAKPSGLPTLPGAQFLEHTLLHQVRLRYPGASPVHRLGRGTSGLVLFARTAEVAAALSASMREGAMTKIYRALIEGHPAEDAFTVDTPIGPVPHPALGTVHAASPSGKPSRSHVRVLERRETTSLVDVRIETGRPHQIRIHMAACGHPLAGDPLYAPGGGIREGVSAVPGDLGYLLHAMSLTLPHPRTGTLLQVECQAPPELRPIAY